MTGAGDVIATSIREANSSGVNSFGACIVIGELTIRTWPSSDWQGHGEIYEPIPDRKRGLSVVLRIIAALCFQRGQTGTWSNDINLPVRRIRAVMAWASSSGPFAAYFNEVLMAVNLVLSLVPSPF